MGSIMLSILGQQAKEPAGWGKAHGTIFPFPCFKTPNTSGSIKQLNPRSAPAAVGKGMWAVDPACVKQHAGLSWCVLEREAETSMGDKHSFSAPIGRAVGTSCWQQTHRAAEAQSQSSQGPLSSSATHSRVCQQVFEGNERQQKGLHYLITFKGGNESTGFNGRNLNDTEKNKQCQSDGHWTRGWCTLEGWGQLHHPGGTVSKVWLPKLGHNKGARCDHLGYAHGSVPASWRGIRVNFLQFLMVARLHSLVNVRAQLAFWYIPSLLQSCCSTCVFAWHQNIHQVNSVVHPWKQYRNTTGCRKLSSLAAVHINSSYYTLV